MHDIASTRAFRFYFTRDFLQAFIFKIYVNYRVTCFKLEIRVNLTSQ